jgi:hypothetical protein
VSIYRTTKRLPQSDVHHVAEHIVGPKKSEQHESTGSPAEDWTSRRKETPAEVLFPIAVRWIETLPLEMRPKALSVAFPRIANMLAMLSSRPDAMMRYLNDLLIDRRGGRRGFPPDVVRELRGLTAHYGMPPPDGSSIGSESNRSR